MEGSHETPHQAHGTALHLAPRDDQQTPHICPLKVLIADDDKVHMSILKRLFRPCDVVLEAKDGNEIIAIMEHDDNKNIDFLFTDGMMPNKTGPAAISILRSRGFTQDMFIITAEDDLSYTLNCKATAVIRKPFKSVDIIEIIDKQRQLKGTHG